jgi:opacity protein-like surface antigen
MEMRTIASCIAAACLLTPAVALADPSCDDSEWFCEETTTTVTTTETVEPDESPVETGPVEKIDPPKKTKPHARSKAKTKQKIKVNKSGKKVQKTTQTKKTVVIYDEVKPKPKREWGINLRAEGVLLGKNKADDAGMGGFGASLRYRPVPAFAFDFGLDFLGGIDWAGDNRREVALSMNGMLFFNPKDMVQFYALGGVAFSWARVDKTGDGDVIDHADARYSYFGMQLGAGLEFRVSKKAALNMDLIGFIRGRTDAGARNSYEYVDRRTGLGTNTSGGGLIRGGVTFYW